MKLTIKNEYLNRWNKQPFPNTCNCPLSEALLVALHEEKLEVLDISNARPYDGSIAAKLATGTYEFFPASKFEAQEFIRLVDFSSHRTTIQHEFYYTMVEPNV